MLRYVIHIGNATLLFLILVGVPRISSRQFGAYQMASVSAWRDLTLWGLAGGAALNGIAAWGLLRKSKDRRASWQWSAAFAGLLLLQYLVFTGRIRFDWLENFLRRLAG